MEKKSFSGKVCSAGLAIAMFYVLGILFNSILIKELFDAEPTKTPIWSGPGFMFAAIAAASALLIFWLSKKIKD